MVTDKEPQRCYLSAAIVYIVILMIVMGIYEYAYAPYGLKCKFMTVDSLTSGQSWVYPAMIFGLVVALTVGSLVFAVSRAENVFDGYMFTLGFTLAIFVIAALGILLASSGNLCANATGISLYAAFWMLGLSIAGAAATYASYKWIIIKRR